MIPRDELERLVRVTAERTAAQAVERTLTGLGINVADPISAQRDFSKLRALRTLLDDAEFQADLAHLRRWRLALERGGALVAGAGIRTTVTIAITALIGLVGLGFKDWFKGWLH